MTKTFEYVLTDSISDQQYKKNTGLNVPNIAVWESDESVSGEGEGRHNCSPVVEAGMKLDLR